MTDNEEQLIKAYRRAGFGLGIVAIGWTLALLFAKGEHEKFTWLIPIAAAALSVLCFSRARQAKQPAD
jgi:hypothetical protein